MRVQGCKRRLFVGLGLICLSAPTAAADIDEQLATLREQVRHEQWSRVGEQLPELVGHYGLSSTQRDYVRLLQGLDHQRRSRHREAIEVYRGFEPDDAHYAEARTNLALAYLRQGWWTDAHRELEQLLERDLPNHYQNRLRMMLGLSRLQQGFYRDARASFGRLDQDSDYAAHGWRGIGLAALHLGDHAGALNAFLRLKALDQPALPDGPFMVAFTYDQMNRLKLAQLSYNEALLFYQNRLQTIEQQLEQADADQKPALERQREQVQTLHRQSQYGLATVYDRQ